VTELVRDVGLSLPWAWEVARGQVTLNDVLTRMAQADKVTQLIRRYDLDRSVATQIAAGSADLEHVLRKRRQDAHLAEFKDRSVLVDAAASGAELVLWLHGLQTLSTPILGLSRYEVDLRGAAGSDKVHKLQLKLAYAAGAHVKVQVAPGGRAVAEPLPRPQDRFFLSDRRLFAALDGGGRSAVTTLEGDLVLGHITWISRFELGMRQDRGADLVIFRHAIRSFEEA